jgi:uncharacterized membrane protein YiaA
MSDEPEFDVRAAYAMIVGLLIVVLGIVIVGPMLGPEERFYIPVLVAFIVGAVCGYLVGRAAERTASGRG